MTPSIGRAAADRKEMIEEDGFVVELARRPELRQFRRSVDGVKTELPEPARLDPFDPFFVQELLDECERLQFRDEDRVEADLVDQGVIAICCTVEQRRFSP